MRRAGQEQQAELAGKGRCLLGPPDKRPAPIKRGGQTFTCGGVSAEVIESNAGRTNAFAMVALCFAVKWTLETNTSPDLALYNEARNSQSGPGRTFIVPLLG
jgi:hypothetical protein